MLNRKLLNKTLLLLLVSILVIFPKAIFADANTLDTIDILVEIQEDGSAKITETRETYLAEGTENYIVIGNLGDSDILDFKVKENGVEYEQKSQWDINLSRREKAYKSGVVYSNGVYELCWGIGEYGKHTYKVEYTVSNFIKQFQDS